MEVFLHLWDEIDDLTGAARHLAVSAASELLESAAPTAAAASAAGSRAAGLSCDRSPACPLG